MLTTELVRRGRTTARNPHGSDQRRADSDLPRGRRDGQSHGRRADRLGVERGQVGLLVDNGLWSVPIDFACLKAGAVRVPLNARLSADEQARMLEATGVRTLVHGTALADRAAELASRIAGLRLVCLGPSTRRSRHSTCSTR